jgi:hypothetical protein
MTKLSMASSILCSVAILATVAAAVGEAAAVEHTFVVSSDYRASMLDSCLICSNLPDDMGIG